MKICSYCQKSCEDNSVFCPNCGAKMPQWQHYDNIYHEVPHSDPYGESAAVTTFILGIISLIVFWIPIFSIASIICGAIAISKSALGLSTKKRTFATLGKIFGAIGLGAGILFTCFWLIYLIIVLLIFGFFSTIGSLLLW